MLEDLKVILGIEGNSLDTRLNWIIATTEQRLLNRLNGVDEVPQELKYIVTEVSAARFNRIGSEGLQSHSVSGESQNFLEDDFAGYTEDIDAWNDKQDGVKKGRVVFL